MIIKTVILYGDKRICNVFRNRIDVRKDPVFESVQSLVLKLNRRPDIVFDIDFRCQSVRIEKCVRIEIGVNAGCRKKNG